MEHGNDGNADVHFAIIDADLDTTVLRQPLFGDVQMAENLDAGNDGGLKPLELGRDRDFLEHAIDPVANAKLMFEGFEMDIRRPQFDGVAQHLVDEADDGRIFRRGVQIGVFLGAILADDLQRRFFFQRADGIGADAETFLHFPLDRLARGQDGLEFQARHGLEGVQPLRGTGGWWLLPRSR